MPRTEPPLSPIAGATYDRLRWGAVVAAFAALLVGGTPEILESAGSIALWCDDDDDDDDARRSRAPREVMQRATAATTCRATSASSRNGELVLLASRPALTASEAFVGGADAASGHATGASAMYAAPFVVPRRRLPIEHAALRASSMRGPIVSAEVEPAVGPDPPASSSLLSAIRIVRERRAMERAHEAAARTAWYREDRAPTRTGPPRTGRSDDPHRSSPRSVAS